MEQLATCELHLPKMETHLRWLGWRQYGEPGAQTINRRPNKRWCFCYALLTTAVGWKPGTGVKREQEGWQEVRHCPLPRQETQRVLSPSLSFGHLAFEHLPRAPRESRQIRLTVFVFPVLRSVFFFSTGRWSFWGWGRGRGEEVSGSEELFCNRPPVLFNTHAAARRLQQPGTISSSLPCDWQQTVCHSVVAWQQQKTKPRHNVGFLCRVSFHRSVYIMYLFTVLAARALPPELRKLDKRAWRASRGCVYMPTVTSRGGYIVDN